MEHLDFSGKKRESTPDGLAKWRYEELDEIHEKAALCAIFNWHLRWTQLLWFAWREVLMDAERCEIFPRDYRRAGG